MITQPFFQIQNDAGDTQITEQNGSTHVGAAQAEVDLTRLASGKFSSNTTDASKAADQLPTPDLSGNAFNFSPALSELRNKLKEIVTANPSDNPNTQNYCRTGPNGELYARDQNSEQLATSDSSKSTFLERTLDGIKGFTDQFQFTTSKDKKLSLKTNQADVTVQKTEQGAFQVTIADKNGLQNLLIHTQEELQKILPQLNALLRTPEKTNQSTLSSADKAAQSGKPDMQTANPDALTIDFKTGIATIAGGDKKNVQVDLNTGDVGVGGFGLGHFVFQQNGSTIMSNGDVIDSFGILTPYSQVLASKSESELATTAATAETNAQSLAAGILAKAGNEEISPGEIGALMALDSSLGVLESSSPGSSASISLARSAISSALLKAISTPSQKPAQWFPHQLKQSKNHSENHALFFESPYQIQHRLSV